MTALTKEDLGALAVWAAEGRWPRSALLGRLLDEHHALGADLDEHRAALAETRGKLAASFANNAADRAAAETALRQAQADLARLHDLALKAHRAQVKAAGNSEEHVDPDADCDAWVATDALVTATLEVTRG